MSEENLLTILYPTPCYIKRDYFKDTYVPSKGRDFIKGVLLDSLKSMNRRNIYLNINPSLDILKLYPFALVPSSESVMSVNDSLEMALFNLIKTLINPNDRFILINIISKYESKTYKQPLCNAIYSLVSDLRHGTDITIIIITAISQELRYTVCETTIEYKIYKVYSYDK